MLTEIQSRESSIRPTRSRVGTKGIVLNIAMDKQRPIQKTLTGSDPDWVALMQRVRDHQDRAAFSDLFTHFAPRIKGFLIKSGADATMAEECAQDVMTTLWRKADQFDPTRASVATWIFTIARNRRIDMLRRQNRPEPEELPWGPEPEPDQADVIALQQDSVLLAKALKTLPEQQRDLIEKAYFGDLTQSEIASLTGLPLGTIKSRIRLALDRLRHLMK
ncbi:MAG: sigma-70 family RNA polymerase sigma factor [Sulfitobacter sp.]|nr:sigma-70 family RNA polymerase sigma factor [Sulfitobacter sp.]